MAYQSLYRKWRPQTFAAMVGQELAARTLANAVASGRIAHAYLFTGPRGTGKTSAARLFAKALNCSDRQGAEPCDACPSCVAIREGRSVDVLEIDGASNRGINEIRELREHVGLAPMMGNYRFYIIDEVHQLTEAAFNALLKTLEEPPRHVIFVLATTDGHKVPATIASRCQQFAFHRIADAGLRERVRYVAAQEGFQIEEGALDLMVAAADGSLRDALSLLDQAVSFCGTDVTEKGLEHVLGLVPAAAVRQFARALQQRNLAEALTLLKQLSAEGTSVRQFNRQLVGYLQQELLEHARREHRDGRWESASLIMALRAFASIDFSTRFAVAPELPLELAAAEVCLLNVSVPSPSVGQSQALNTSPGAGPPFVGSGGPATTTVAPGGRTGRRPTASPRAGSSVSDRPQGGPDDTVLRPAVVAGAPPFDRQSAAASGVVDQARRQWEAVIERLRVADKKIVALCNSCQLLGIEGDVLLLTASGNDFVYQQITRANVRAVIEPILRQVFGRELTLRCELHPVSLPQRASEARTDEAAEHAQDSLQAVDRAEDGATAKPEEEDPKGAALRDPTVKMAVEVFGARVDRVLLSNEERTRLTS
ncbi:MAG: DNA polymerase III subunit gamma/tau [Chloroflexi bacterium]|nr:DNA polymerase III subunit gamma/tau [Chloroflexota bacterium]